MKHGWFKIPGVQTGEREISERLNPLRILIPYVKGASVLDLGCAEGVIGKWLLDHGATVLDGLDKHEPYLETARDLTPRDKYNARFLECDFDHFRRQCGKLKLRKQYDIVLALNVVQKLKAPRRFLWLITALAKSIFVYSGPSEILCDPRSGNRPTDIKRFLQAEFKLIGKQEGIHDEKKGHLGVRLIFQRLTPAEAIRAHQTLRRREKQAKAKRKRLK